MYGAAVGRMRSLPVCWTGQEQGLGPADGPHSGRLQPPPEASQARDMKSCKIQLDGLHEGSHSPSRPLHHLPGPSIHALSAFPFPSGSTYFPRLVLGFAESVTLSRHLSCSAVAAKRLSLCHASCTANRPTRPDGWSSSIKATAGPARRLLRLL